jgi:tRNA-2-methylthio-N6-dimethylallyladenosine synthase
MSDHIVVFEGHPRLTGQTVRLEITEATSFTLFGDVVTGEQVGVEDGDGCEAPAPVPAGQRRHALPLI